MLRLPLLIGLALAVAFSGGIWSARRALDAGMPFGITRLGAWEAYAEAQTARADPYARAARAMAGRLLYGSAEGISFTAGIDDAGRPLDGQWCYRLSGSTPPARLWTLYVRLPDGATMVPDLPSALSSWQVLRRADGDFSIALANGARPGNWLALPPANGFTLVLTLFDSPAAGSAGLIDLSMPRIERTDCRHG